MKWTKEVRQRIKDLLIILLMSKKTLPLKYIKKIGEHGIVSIYFNPLFNGCIDYISAAGETAENLIHFLKTVPLSARLSTGPRPVELTACPC